LYRKLIGAALAFILLGFILAILPGGYYIYDRHVADAYGTYSYMEYTKYTTPFIYVILQPMLAGALAIYLYIRKFLNDLAMAGYGQRDIESVKQELAFRGGPVPFILIIGAVFFGFVAFAAIATYMLH
jgi:hypothetical protein